MVKSYNGASLLVWCRFTQDIEALLGKLQTEGISVRVFSGAVKSSTREENRVAFEKGEYQVALIQQKTCYRSVRFSKAVASIYHNNEFSGDVRSQSEDRHIDAHNDGVKEIVDIQVNKCIDKHVNELVKDKTFGGKKFMECLGERLYHG